MRLAAYLRVSTAKQAEDGCGLDVQRDAVCSWAKAHGHTIASWHTDAVSGTLSFEERYELADALDRVRRVQADGLVVYRLDRLARDLALQESLLAHVKKWGGRVYSTVEDEDRLLDDATGDPARVLIRQVLGAVSEFERSMIRLRTQAGSRRKRAAGGYAGGAIPYGWNLVRGRVIPYEPEQTQRAVILAMRTAGASYRAIAATLSGSGAPPPRGGKTWHATTIKRIAEYDPTKVPS